ncbi:svf1p [Saccharomyces arboricola H-6]|uniref:Svf1p n=1 Tax=Saccharomyces arboricola (strain H-6 / AS 2.3317 / CBS 10644) TaxID=1160507 RepID=J8Q3Q3_SACAR|nr:svf1p [Saccharomyces arboricola H-6]
MLKWIKGGLSAVTGMAEPEYGKDYFHSVSDRVKNKQPYRETTREDFFWQAPDHTNVETVISYFSDLKTGIFGFAQIIHSNIIGLHTQSQFTFRIFDSKNPEDLNIWTSTKLENFYIKDANFYADNLSFELSEDGESYHIQSSVCDLSVIDLHVKRLVPGAKIGDDPASYYGNNIDEPWGSMRHVFWPRNACYGTIKVKKEIVTGSGDELSSGDEGGEDEDEDEESGESEEETDSEEESDSEEVEITYEDRTIILKEEDPAISTFIMAFQGMKPHHAAKAWNFMFFHSEKYSAVLMEFTTPKSYANTKVSAGIITDDKEVLALTTNNVVEHLNSEVDSVGWKVPKNIKITFKGISAKVKDEQLESEKGNGEDEDGAKKADNEEGEEEDGEEEEEEEEEEYKNIAQEDKFDAIVEGPLDNLVERIDVMGEIPNFVKNIVSGVAGTKPFIYQYADPKSSTLQINGGEKIHGVAWTEVTFISESDVISEESYNEA